MVARSPRHQVAKRRASPAGTVNRWVAPGAAPAWRGRAGAGPDSGCGELSDAGVRAVPYGWSGEGPETAGASRSVSAQNAVVRCRGPTAVGVGISGPGALGLVLGAVFVSWTSVAPDRGVEFGSTVVRVFSRIDIEVSSQMRW